MKPILASLQTQGANTTPAGRRGAAPDGAHVCSRRFGLGWDVVERATDLGREREQLLNDPVDRLRRERDDLVVNETSIIRGWCETAEVLLSGPMGKRRAEVPLGVLALIVHQGVAQLMSVNDLIQPGIDFRRTSAKSL